VLNLSQNQISEIPESLSQLTNLTELYLWGNQISEIPESLSKLTNLTELYLWQNQISGIPESLSKLTNLTELYLWQNQISEIPESLSQLTNLTELNLSQNQISEIPESLSQLTNLTELNLSQNQISEIPESLSQLTNLTGLNLSQNQISEIPESLSQLTNLTGLYLSQNQISEIPESLSQLTNLTGLSLWQNQIGEIPESLSQLTNLTGLYLSTNQISKIPESLSQLTNLTELNLSHNQISEIPESLSQLTNLTELYLWQNQISEVPESLLQLTNLTKLNLSHNQISKIPESLSQLTNLKLLGLERNVIRELPESLKALKCLEVLHLEENPLSISPEVLLQGWGEKYDDPGNPQAILDYYFTTRDPDQTQTLYEAKLLLVGEGGAGKTSLAKKLLNPDYKLKPETEDTSTKGIDILKWEFERNGKQYRIKIWDFGGQEIYHQTHQFFLTERSLYLLVGDSRKEDTDHYYWLQIVQLLSDSSPVLLIQNEKQDRNCNLNYNQLRGEFESLRDTHRINLADNRGLQTLKDELEYELERLIPNGIPFPNKWLSVRYALENDGRNYIDCADYESTCRRYGITNRDEMNQLSRFLHELGICLHFQKDPILCNKLILKPNWGTAAVYKILDNETVKKNLGQFSDAELETIWKDQQYAEMRHALLQLMKEFKVCYEIPRRKGQYIAPHLLSPDSPEYDWNPEGNLILRYRYKGFMPKGILTRFIVEMHRDIENVSDPDRALVWKTGVILKDGSSRAQIIEHYQNREITIRVSGSRPRDLLTVINRKFKEIHDDFERLNYDTLIPCNCTTCKPNQKPFTFPLDRLHQCLDRGRYTIECHESGEDVNVRGLIDEVIQTFPRGDGLTEDGSALMYERFAYEGGKSYRRDRSRPTKETQSPNINLSVTVPITNSNHQEQKMENNSNKPQITNNLQGSTIGNFANEVRDNARQQTNQYNYSAERQSLAEAAKEIQDLIEQLSKTYPTDTLNAKVQFAGAIAQQVEANPPLAQRLLSASKAGGVAALEQFLNHPLASFVIAALGDWQKSRQQPE
jgi:internalin A